jgi:O-antigen/teichoic acid export membrane protein
MILLSIIAKPLLILLYSAKWVGAVPYFQFLCLGFGILLIVHQCSLTALKAVGHSDYVLRLEIIKKVIGIALLIFGIMYLGIWGIMTALTINSVIELFLNGFYLNRAIGYGSKGQIIDILPSFLISIGCGIPTYYLSVILLANTLPVVNVIISVVVFLLLYILCSYLFKVDALRMFKGVITGMLLKKR